MIKYFAAQWEERVDDIRVFSFICVTIELGRKRHWLE
jgi:hypothetical protein